MTIHREPRRVGHNSELSVTLTLEQARRFALSLPEAAEEPHHELSSFRVRGKIFATVPPGGKHLHVFVDEHQREAVVASAPTAFEKLWWGAKVVGVRVLLSKARSSAVSELLYAAWCRKAPRRLVTSSPAPRMC
jgi:hypothetical protein